MVYDISPEVCFCCSSSFWNCRELTIQPGFHSLEPIDGQKWHGWIIPQAAAVQPQVQILSRLHTTILAQSPKVHLIVWVSQHLLLPRHLLLRRHPPLHQNPLQPPVSASDIWPFCISHLIVIPAAWKICIYNCLFRWVNSEFKWGQWSRGYCLLQ